MWNRSWCPVISVVVLSVVFLAGFFAPSVLAKDTLVIGIQDVVSSLDPAKAFEMMTYGLLHQMYENLVTYRDDNFIDPVPELAESWEIQDDGLTWHFHLRKGVLFSSGNPLTVDDVVFSLRRVLELKAGPSYILTQLGLTKESLSIIDDDTIQLVLNKPYSPQLVLACLAAPVASVLDHQELLKHEQDGDLGSSWLEDHSAGTGRFMLTEQTRWKQYRLQANQYYWGEPSAFQKLIVKSIQEPFEQAELLLQGEIDLAWNLQPTQVDMLLPSSSELEFSQTSQFFLYHIGMNVAYEPFSHKDVRNALRYAIDYDGLIDFILQGAGEKIQTFIPKGLLGHNSAMPFRYDLDKAEALLKEAGYSDGFDVELKCPNHSPWLDMAAKVSADLKQIGINVTTVPLDPNTLWESLITRDSQMLLWFWIFDYFDPDSSAKLFAHSDSLGDDATFQTLPWWFSYVNVDISKRVEEASLETDRSKREELYKHITETILHDGPHIILCSPVMNYGMRAQVAPFIDNPTNASFDFPAIR